MKTENRNDISLTATKTGDICDAIKQNQMKLQFSSSICAPYLKLYFGENPIKIRLTVPEI